MLRNRPIVHQLMCLVGDNIPWGPGLCDETPGATTWERIEELAKRLRTRLGWIWRAYLRSLCCKAGAMLCALLSGLVLWSEVRALALHHADEFIARCSALDLDGLRYLVLGVMCSIHS